jgi:hypothetical protein
MYCTYRRRQNEECLLSRIIYVLTQVLTAKFERVFLVYVGLLLSNPKVCF